MVRLLPVIIIVGLLAGGIYAISNNLVTLPPQLSSVTQQTKLLSQRTQDVSTHVGNVLGSYTQNNEFIKVNDTKNSSSEPIHEKALEYGRYVYCQQVVKDYEQDHPTASPES
jgi:hypothetical protein